MRIVKQQILLTVCSTFSTNSPIIIGWRPFPSSLWTFVGLSLNCLHQSFQGLSTHNFIVAAATMNISRILPPSLQKSNHRMDSSLLAQQQTKWMKIKCVFEVNNKQRVADKVCLAGNYGNQFEFLSWSEVNYWTVKVFGFIIGIVK